MAWAGTMCAQKADVPVAQGDFQPNWEDLGKWECPEWYKDAKFGVWAHWDPQCEAAYSDWYARYMYYKDSGAYWNHVNKYGDPCVPNTEHGYKDLCNAWKAQNWDPDYLISLYRDMGARFFCAMGQHHDNFDCWDSEYQEWNSVNIGPKRDVVGDWSKACDKYGLPLMVSMHGAHAWTFFENAWDYDAKMTKEDGIGKWWEGYDPNELYAQNHEHSEGWWDSGNIHNQWNWGNGVCPPSKEYMQKFQNRVLQCVNKYHPKMLYFDDTVLPFVGHTDEIGLNILAHAYNTDPEMVVTGKVLQPIHKEAMLWDIERGIPDRPQDKYWQTCTCIGGWHYGDTNYKSAQTVINMLIDIVSKNGNLLLSIPVRGDGTIDDAEKRFVKEVTTWMQQNGRSIHGTRVWKSFGEGPLVDASNPLNNQGFNEGQNYSNRDVRYVVKYAKNDTERDTVFATIMRWPDAEQFTFANLGRTSQYFSGEVESCELLGHGAVAHTLGMDGVTVQIPATHTNPNAPVFAFTFKPGTDQAITLSEMVEYCKTLTADRSEDYTVANSGSPNTSALDDLDYATREAEKLIGTTAEQEAEALESLRKAYKNYTSNAVTPAGAPIYDGDNLTTSKLVEAANFTRTSATTNGKRFGEPRYWEVTNFNIPNGGDGTKQGIDSYNGTPALMLGVWNDRANALSTCDLSQAAIRRTIHLEPGVYYFGSLFNTSYRLTEDAYMYAIAGSADDLKTKDIPTRALAWARLNTAPGDNTTWWGITFIVTEEQDITLGFQADLNAGSATQEFRATKLQLLKYKDSAISSQRDVTVRYLVERDHFSREDATISTRFATPKYWTVENFKIPNGGDGTKNGLDRYPGYDCLMLGVWNDAAQAEGGKSVLKDARIYRKLSLDAGIYTFQAQYEANYNMHARSLIFASSELFPTQSLRTKAIKVTPFYTAKTGTTDWHGITFQLDTPQDVYVGWQVDLTNGSATQEFRASAVRLLYEPLPKVDAVQTPNRNTSAANAAVYDLQGRVASPDAHNTVVVTGGKKVIRK